MKDIESSDEDCLEDASSSAEQDIGPDNCQILQGRLQQMRTQIWKLKKRLKDSERVCIKCFFLHLISFIFTHFQRFGLPLLSFVLNTRGALFTCLVQLCLHISWSFLYMSPGALVQSMWRVVYKSSL